MLWIGQELYELLNNGLVKTIVFTIAAFAGSSVGSALLSFVFKKIFKKISTSHDNDYKNLQSSYENAINDLKNAKEELKEAKQEIKKLSEKSKDYINELNSFKNNVDYLTKEFVKSRKSDKKIEAQSQVLALMATSNPNYVKDGTAEKICGMLGIREINEKINDELEAINIPKEAKK